MKDAFRPSGPITERPHARDGQNQLIVGRTGLPPQASVAPGDIPKDITSHPGGRGPDDSARQD